MIVFIIALIFTVYCNIKIFGFLKRVTGGRPLFMILGGLLIAPAFMATFIFIIMYVAGA